MDPSSVAGWDRTPRKPPNGARPAPQGNRAANDNVQTMLTADLGRQEGGLEVGLSDVTPTIRTGFSLNKTTTTSTNAPNTRPPAPLDGLVPLAQFFAPNLKSPLHQMGTRTHRHTPPRDETQPLGLTSSRVVGPSTLRVESGRESTPNTPKTHPGRTPLRVQTAVVIVPQAEPHSVHTEDADGEDEDDIVILDSHMPFQSRPDAIIDLADGESDEDSVEIVATVIPNAPVSASSTSTGASKPVSSHLFSPSPISTPLTPPPPPERLFTPDPPTPHSKSKAISSRMKTTGQPRSRSVSVISLRTTPPVSPPPQPLSPTLSPPPEYFASSSKNPRSTSNNTKKRKRKIMSYVSVPFVFPSVLRSYIPVERVQVPCVHDAASTSGVKETSSRRVHTRRDASPRTSGTAKGKERAIEKDHVRHAKPTSKSISKPSASRMPQDKSGKAKGKSTVQKSSAGNTSLMDAMNTSFAPIVISDDDDDDAGSPSAVRPSPPARKKAKTSSGSVARSVGRKEDAAKTKATGMQISSGATGASMKGKKRRRIEGGSTGDYEPAQDEVERVKKKRRMRLEGEDEDGVMEMEIINLANDSGSDSDFEVLGMVIGKGVKRKDQVPVYQANATSNAKSSSNPVSTKSSKPLSSSTKKRLVNASDLPVPSSSSPARAVSSAEAHWSPSKAPSSRAKNVAPSRPSSSTLPQSQPRTRPPPSIATPSRPPVSSGAGEVPPSTVSPTRPKPRPIFKGKATGVPDETGARIATSAPKPPTDAPARNPTPVDPKKPSQLSSFSGRPLAEVYIPVLVRPSATRAASVTTLSPISRAPSLPPTTPKPPPSKSTPPALAQPLPAQTHSSPISKSIHFPTPTLTPPPSIVVAGPDSQPWSIPQPPSPIRSHSPPNLHLDLPQTDVLTSGSSDFLQYPGPANEPSTPSASIAPVPQDPTPTPSAPFVAEPLFLPSSPSPTLVSTTKPTPTPTPPPPPLSLPPPLPPQPPPTPPSSSSRLPIHKQDSDVLGSASSLVHPLPRRPSAQYGPEEHKILILNVDPFESEETLKENVRFLNVSAKARPTQTNGKQEGPNAGGLGVGLKGRRCLFEDPLLPLGIFGHELEGGKGSGSDEAYYLGGGLFWGDTVLAVEPIQAPSISKTPSSSSVIPGASASMGDRRDMTSVKKVDFLQLNKAKKGKKKVSDGVPFSKEKAKEKSRKKTAKDALAVGVGGARVQDPIHPEPLPEFQVGGSGSLFDPGMDFGEHYFLQEAFGPSLSTSPTANRHRNLHIPSTSGNRAHDDDILKELSLHDLGSFAGSAEVSIGLMDDGSSRWLTPYQSASGAASSSGDGGGETIDPTMLFGGGGGDGIGDEALEEQEVATTLGTLSEPDDASGHLSSPPAIRPKVLDDESESGSESDVPLRARFGPPGGGMNSKATPKISAKTSKKPIVPPPRTSRTRQSSSSSSSSDSDESDAAQILGRGRRTVKRPARYRHGFVTHDGMNVLSDFDDEDKPTSSRKPRPAPSATVDESDEDTSESSDDDEVRPATCQSKVVGKKAVRDDDDEESASNFSESSSVQRRKKRGLVRKVVVLDPDSSESDDSDDDDDVPFASQTQASKVLIGPPVGSRPLTNISRNFQRKYPTDPEATFCHQCRRKTNIAKVKCEECDKRFCRRCLDIRYPDRQYAKAMFESGTCPSCETYCNCTKCSRGRGEVYISSVNPNPGEAPSKKNTIKSRRTSRPEASLPASTASTKDVRAPRSQSRRQPNDGAESDDSTANYPILRLPSAHAAPPPVSLAYWGVIYDLKGAKIGAGFVEPGLMLPKIVHAAAVDSSAEGRKGLLDHNQIHEGIGQPRLELMPPSDPVPPSSDHAIHRSPSPRPPSPPPPIPPSNDPLAPAVAEAIASIVARPKRIVKKTPDGPKQKFNFVGRLQRSWKARLTNSKRNRKEPKVKHGFVGKRWPLRMPKSNEAARNPELPSDSAEEDDSLEEDENESVGDDLDVIGFDDDDDAAVDANPDYLDDDFVLDTGIELPPASPMSYSQFDDIGAEPSVHVPLSNEDMSRVILLALGAINLPLSAIDPSRTALDLVSPPFPESESPPCQAELAPPCVVPAADKGIAPEPPSVSQPDVLANDNPNNAAPATNVSTAG